MKRDKGIIFVISFIVPLLFCFLFNKYLQKIGYNIKDFAGVEIIKTLLGIWATLLGFIITATSILLTMGGKEYIIAFKESKHYSTVLYTYFLSSFSLFVATIFGIYVICVNTWNHFLFLTLLYIIIVTLLLILFSILFLFFLAFKSDT